VIRVALLALALILAGIDIPPPADGTVVSRERIGGVRVERIPETCDFWACRPQVVAWRQPEYRVTYRWSLAGISGEADCVVTPGEYWRAEVGQRFGCRS